MQLGLLQENRSSLPPASLLLSHSVFFALPSLIGCVAEQPTKRGGVVCLDTKLLYMFIASGSQAGRQTHSSSAFYFF